MNYETNQVIRDARTFLGRDGVIDEELLALLAEDSVNEVTAYCRLEFLPYQLIGITARITADRYRTEMNGGGTVGSVTEGDRRIDFAFAEGGAAPYEERLKPFVNIKGRLPSENAEAGR